MATMSVGVPGVGDTTNQAWKNDKSKFGLKMLQKMGWTEGKGLGKNEDGVSEHVKVAKKSNNLGLGAKNDSSGAAGWASAAVSFNGVLEALGKAYGSGTAAGSKRKKGKEAKTKAKKARKKQGHSGDLSAAAGSSSSSSSGGEGGIGAPSATAKAASSCPSRARRVRSKDVKGLSAADLRAILGHAAITTNPLSPSLPVIGSGDGGGAEPKATKKEKSSSKGKIKTWSSPPAAAAEAPHRPRTRSMDETPTADEPAVISKRPRKRSSDVLEEERLEAGGNGDAAEGAAAAAADTIVRSSVKKARGAEQGGEEPAAVAGSSKDKKRQRKGKK